MLWYCEILSNIRLSISRLIKFVSRPEGFNGALVTVHADTSFLAINIDLKQGAREAKATPLVEVPAYELPGMMYVAL